MKNWKRTAALILAVVLMAGILTGCTNEKSAILNTMGEFLYACQNLDVDALLNCIDPDTADPIRLGLALYSEAVGKDYEDVTDTILQDFVYQVFGANYIPDDFLSTLDITDMKVTVEKDVAEIQCVVHFEVAGEKFARQSSVLLIKKLNKWYVAYVDLFA